ncbi:ABC transporter permease [Cryobacterium sp. Hb1]|uniref:ABC transporter permease n=1 Tax=Cryobacterium sp. Hb1 TaxID=1259147 RepID=UPI00272B0352|nr:ABC transporter permease [Cryobacterium sp. Hb1]
MGLYALFLGSLPVDNLQSRFPTATNSEVQAFVDAWVFAGITMITILTTGLAALSVFIEDSSSGRFKDFLVLPIRRASLIFGYMTSSFIVSIVMTVVVVAISQGYTAIRGNVTMTATELLLTLGYVVVAAAAFSALSGFIVTFVRSNSAFAAMISIVGTVIGFLAGAYIPAGTLPTGVVNVRNAMPFARAVMLLRQPFTAHSAEALTDGQSEAVSALNDFYGIAISVGDFDVSSARAFTALAIVCLVFALLSSFRLSRRIR